MPPSGIQKNTVSPIFLASAPLMNPRTLCACQPVAFMIWASVAPPLRWSRPRTVAFLLPSRAAAGLLPALPRFPLAALGLGGGLGLLALLCRCLGLVGPLRGRRGRFRRAAAVQALDRFPNPADRRLPVRELLDGRAAGDTVPDLHQPVRRPLGNQAGQLLLAAEALALAGLLLGGVRRDAVLCVDRVRFHFRFPWPRVAVMAFITPVGGTSKSILRARRKESEASD